MQISPGGVRFIKSEEGFSANFYGDVGHQAIGYGHDLKPGETIAEPISQDDAETLMLTDLAPIQRWLNVHFPALTQGQYDALCDFGYNLGLGALTTMLGHGLDNATAQIPLWDHVQGKVSAGLYSRRMAEVQMFVGNSETQG